MSVSFDEAMRAYQAGDYAEALDKLQAAGPGDVDEGDLVYAMGLCLMREDRFEDALVYLEQVVTSSSDPGRVSQCRMALAYIYCVTERFKLASYELDRLAEKGFKPSIVKAALGYAYFHQGLVAEAIKRYEEALALDPECPNALNGLGYILASEGKELPRALTLCRKAVDKRPNNPAYLDSLGFAYFKLGMLSEAGKHMERALALAPDSATIRLHATAIHEVGL